MIHVRRTCTPYRCTVAYRQQRTCTSCTACRVNTALCNRPVVTVFFWAQHRHVPASSCDKLLNVASASYWLISLMYTLFLQWFARTHTRTAMPILAGHRAGATTTSLVPTYVPAVPWCAVSVLQVFPFQAVFCCKARGKDLTKCHKVNRKLRKCVVLLRAQRSKFLLCKFECKNTAQLTYRCK